MKLQVEEIKEQVTRRKYDQAPSKILHDCLKIMHQGLKEWQKDLKYFLSIKEGKRRGYVYYIMNYDNGLYKIGRTKAPEHRLKTLKANSGLPLILMYKQFTDDMYLLEECAHNHFSFPPHEQVYGEWFRIAEDDYANDFWLCNEEFVFYDDLETEIYFADNNIMSYQLHIRAIEIVLRSREPETNIKFEVGGGDVRPGLKRAE